MWNGMLLPTLLKTASVSSVHYIPLKASTAALVIKRNHGNVIPSHHGQCRLFTRGMAMTKRSGNELSKESAKGGKGQLTVGQKVQQAGKDTMYIGIIIVGIGVTVHMDTIKVDDLDVADIDHAPQNRTEVSSLMFGTVFKELFSSKSPNGVYTNALNYCLIDSEIVEELGEPIKGYGEETRRRRRRHVNYMIYDKDGVKHMRMKFYMKGSKRRATVNLEVKENESGKYDYRYLFVELEGYPQKTIILEDNR